jgi:hypothetical protein
MTEVQNQEFPGAKSSDSTSPGSSLEQQEAEELIIGLLAKALGVPLTKKRFELPAGLEIDGCCESPRILCEAWAHIGTPKSAQKNKVMADAMKLLFAVSLALGNQRLILAFADESAASHFRGDSWMAQALKEKGIETMWWNCQGMCETESGRLRSGNTGANRLTEKRSRQADLSRERFHLRGKTSALVLARSRRWVLGLQAPDT